MKKLLSMIIALTLIVSSVALVSGCKRKDKLIDESGNVTLDFWSVYPEGDPGNKWIEELIDEFEKEHTNIKVNHLGISFWDYFTKITTAQTNPTGPEIYMHTTTDNGLRAAGGISMDISSYFSEEGLNTSVFSESELAALTSTVNGKEGVFGVPWQTDGRMLYYNVEHVNELKNTTDAAWQNTKAGKNSKYGITGKPADLIGDVDWDGDGQNDVRGPKTYGELMAYAELLTKSSNNKIDRLGFHVDVGNNSILNFLWNIGGEVFENGKPNLENNALAKQAFQTWYDIARIFTPAQTNGFIDGSGTTDTNNLFYSGQVSMMISVNGVPWTNDTLGENKIKLGVCSIPYEGIAPEERANFSGGFSVEISNRLTKEDPRVAQAAYEFVEYLMSDEVQLSVVDRVQNMPGSTAVYDTLREQETDLVKKFVFSEMEYRRPMDFVADAADWINDVTENLTEYVSGQQSLEEALKNAQKDIEKRQAIN